MSEIYESTALAFELPSKAAQQYAVDLHLRVCDTREGLAVSPDIPTELHKPEISDAWVFDVQEMDDAGLLITTGDCSCEFVHSLAAFIRHLLKKFDPTGFVQFEWSRSGSLPEPTCFSGGAAHVTADKVRYFTTQDWLEKCAKSETGRRTNRTWVDLND